MVTISKQLAVWRREIDIARDRPYWLAFNFFEGIGPQRFRKLLLYFGSAERIWKAGEEELSQAGLATGLRHKFLLFRQWWQPQKFIFRRRQFHYQPDIYRQFSRWLAGRERARQWNWVQRRQAYRRQTPVWLETITWLDDDYPLGLLPLESSPPLVYFRGRADFLQAQFWQRPMVAIVGTRKVTAYGRQVTQQLAAGLAAAGVVVISGMARGVDSLAHEAVLARGGDTVAVLGTGVDVVYPLGNRSLYEKMATNGGLLSEFPPGFPPLPGNFPARNRIIAGLSRLVVVTEAAQKSGSLITARLAAEQGKDVLAVPGPITSDLSQGTSYLIKQGAKLVTAVDDILGELQLALPAVKVNTAAMEPQQQRIWQALADGEKYTDELVRELKLPASQLGSILSIMAIKGWLVDLGGGRWGRQR